MHVVENVHVAAMCVMKLLVLLYPGRDGVCRERRVVAER
jgi:hypothetical protein